MFARTFSPFGEKRLLAVSSVVILVAVAALVSLAVLSPAGRTAHAAALNSSSGGGCFATTPVCTFKQGFADADFGSVSNDGCIVTDAFVNAFQGVTRPGNTTGQFAFVGIEKFDVCNNIPLEEAFSEDFTGAIQFGSSLSTATVTGSATMFDKVSNTTFTATINVAWQGFGPTTYMIDSLHFRTSGLILNEHSTGTNRAAEAAGTLSDGTTNFAAAPTLNADLGNSAGGSAQITTP
jgi:hypothetical protein